MAESHGPLVFDAKVAPTLLSQPCGVKALTGHLNVQPFGTSGVNNGGKPDTLQSMMSRCRIEDVGMILSMYTNVPLLFTQAEANRDEKGAYVSRQARTFIARSRHMRGKQKELAMACDAVGKGGKAGKGEKGRKGGKGGKAGKGSPKGKGKATTCYENNSNNSEVYFDGAPNSGLENRGYMQVAPHSFFTNSCQLHEGRVLRCSTVVSSGPIGFITNATTQPLIHESGKEMGCKGVCFSNEPACPCCGLVPTNLITCLLGARKDTSSTNCLLNALEEMVCSFSAHEELFRRQNDLSENAWSDCDQCKFHFSNMREAGDAIKEAINEIRNRFTEEEIVQSFDVIGQHRFKDIINTPANADVPFCKEESIIAQVGPLAEVIEAREPLHDYEVETTLNNLNKRLRLLEDCHLHLYNNEGNIVSSFHKKGSIVEWPSDACTMGTRMPVMDVVSGPGGVETGRFNMRRRPPAEIGERVRCSFSHRDRPVDEHRVSKTRYEEYKKAGYFDDENIISPIVANLVVPETVDLYRAWQQRALDAYATLDLLVAVTAPMPPLVIDTHEAIRAQCMPEDADLVTQIDTLAHRGSPGLSCVPLSALRGMRREQRRVFQAAAFDYNKNMEDDQSVPLCVIDKWLADRRAKFDTKDGGYKATDTELLTDIHSVLTTQYMFSNGKHSDLDQFIVPLKLRIGVSDGISKGGKWSSVRDRLEYRGLGLRGEELHASAAREIDKHMTWKYDRLASLGAWRTVSTKKTKKESSESL